MTVPAFRMSIRRRTAADDAAIRAAIVEEQDFERELHDSRRLGAEIADAYFAWLQRCVEKQHGAVFVAELDGVLVGYVACWVTDHDAVAETSDSNVCGYVSDICVLSAFRGRGIAGALLDAAEQHVGAFGVRRMRIVSLAANVSAQRAYLKHGFEPYEVVFEKRL